MGRLRIAILGCGNIARQVHVPLLRAIAEVEVSVLADPDEQARRAVLAQLPSASGVSDWREAIARPDVDAVLVSLPTQEHAEAAILALRAGRHVYLEKPIALDLDEADRVLAARKAAPARVVSMMGFNYRRNPLVERAAAQLRAGAIGDVHSARTVFTSGLPVTGWRARRDQGGGVLLDLASHHVDLVRHLLGQEVESVFARVRSRQTQDDTASLDIRMQDGCTVQIAVALGSVDEDRIEVIGTLGTLLVDRIRGTDVMRHAPRGGEAGFRVGQLGRPWYRLQKRRSPWQEPSFGPTLAAFVTACRTGASATPDLHDGWHVMQVIDAARRSADMGSVVRIGQT